VRCKIGSIHRLFVSCIISIHLISSILSPSSSHPFPVSWTLSPKWSSWSWTLSILRGTGLFLDVGCCDFIIDCIIFVLCSSGLLLLSFAGLGPYLSLTALLIHFYLIQTVLRIISPNTYYILKPVLAETYRQSMSNLSLYYFTGRSAGTFRSSIISILFPTIITTISARFRFSSGYQVIY
jgi:hypothetical protein